MREASVVVMLSDGSEEERKEGVGTMDGESTFVEVVSVVVDSVTDRLIDAINVVLAAGQWEQAAVLALSLREHALAVGDRQLAVLVEDIRAIALDAVASPSGDDGVIQGSGGDQRTSSRRGGGSECRGM